MHARQIQPNYQPNQQPKQAPQTKRLFALPERELRWEKN